MPIYKYEGYRNDGKKITSTRFAGDEVELKVSLKEEGVYLKTFSVMKEKRKSDFLALSSRVNKTEFTSFCQQFSIMLKAGINIGECLNTLRKQNFGTVFKNAISNVYEDVLKGSLLSQAFEKYPKIFPNFFCSMIYVGELAGNLETVLKRTASYYEQDLKTKKKAKTALVYPIFLLFMIVIIVFALMTFVVPTFTDVIINSGGEIPGITKAVMICSEFFVKNVLWIVVGSLSLIVILALFFKTEFGKYSKDKITYNFPIVRNIAKAQLTARFCTSFSILLSSGMPIVDAMESLTKVLGNKLFEKKFQFAIDEVKRGKKIGRALSNTELFPSMLVEMIGVGEDTGSLEEVLNTVGEYYTVQLDTTVARATALLEPCIIVIMGFCVGFILLSVMLPMLSMIQSVEI